MRTLDCLPELETRLSDPIVAGWTLDRMREARSASDQIAEQAAVLLFNDGVLAQLIRMPDPDLLPDQLFDLPAERFRNVASLILERWPAWLIHAAVPAARILVQICPERALEMFRRYLWPAVEDGIARDVNKTLGVLEALTLLAPSRRHDLVERLLSILDHELEGVAAELVFAPIVRLAAAGNFRGLGGRIIDHLAGEADSKQQRRRARGLGAAIARDAAWLSYVFDEREPKWHQSLVSLAPLFAPDAPLALLDALVAPRGAVSLEETVDILRRAAPAHHTRLLCEIAAEIDGRPAVARRASAALSGLIAGLLIDAHCLDRPRLEGLSVSEALVLAAPEMPSVPRRAFAIEGVLAAPRDALVGELRTRLSGPLDGYAGLHVVKLAGELAHPQLLDAVVAVFMGEDDDLADEAAQVLPRFGEAALGAVLSCWAKLKGGGPVSSACSVLAAVGGDGVVEHLASSYPEMRNEYLEQWCHAAEANPDPRLTDLLGPELKRDHPVINEAFLKITLVLGQTHPRLDELRVQLAAQRKRTQTRLRSRNAEDFVDETLRIELRCSACGDTNRFESPAVFINPHRPSDAPYVGGDLECPSCGADEELEPTGMMNLALIAEMLKISALKKSRPGATLKTPLRFVQTRLTDGSEIAMGEAIRRYSRSVKEEPAFVKGWLGLGNCYFNAEAPRRAERCYSKCVELDPSSPEAALKLATLVSRRGENASALKILERSLASRAHWMFHLLRCSKLEFGKEFAELYNRLRAGGGVTEGVFLHPDFLGAESRVGRNDRCPCGSGKKYKKCCAARH